MTLGMNMAAVLLGVVALASPRCSLAGPIADAPPLIVGLTKILNFLLSIVGVVAIIGLVVAGFLYFFAGGDMRQVNLAKKATLGAIAGIVIALGGYVIIRTITAQF